MGRLPEGQGVSRQSNYPLKILVQFHACQTASEHLEDPVTKSSEYIYYKEENTK